MEDNLPSPDLKQIKKLRRKLRTQNGIVTNSERNAFKKYLNKGSTASHKYSYVYYDLTKEGKQSASGEKYVRSSMEIPPSWGTISK